MLPGGGEVLAGGFLEDAQSALVFHMIDGEELPLLINFGAGKSNRSPNEASVHHGKRRHWTRSARHLQYSTSLKPKQNQKSPSGAEAAAVL